MAENLMKGGRNPQLLGELNRSGSKMGNQFTIADGITFDSQAEASRYHELKLLLRQKVIKSLLVHQLFPLTVNGIKVGVYEADFCYYQNGRQIVEDVKGHRTPLYRLKKNLMHACYGIEIIEIDARKKRRNLSL